MYQAMQVMSMHVVITTYGVIVAVLSFMFPGSLIMHSNIGFLILLVDKVMWLSIVLPQSTIADQVVTKLSHSCNNVVTTL